MHYFCIKFSKFFWGGGIGVSRPPYWKILDPPLRATVAIDWYRKSHKRFRLLPKSTTMDDHIALHCTNDAYF